jgi:hypothetical protein
LTFKQEKVLEILSKLETKNASADDPLKLGIEGAFILKCDDVSNRTRISVNT